ncbi:MAG: selenocysteine lyase/cysteine desulfurase [Myxococcota bacterium]
MLNIRIPADLDDACNLSSHIPAEARPVVFIGPYEHHSNELPWRESIADVVVIDEDRNGRIDLALLEEKLILYADRPMRIGSFSAASNVTGIGSNTREISALLHRHGALSFWDFAAAGPYVEIEMNMADDEPDGHLLYKDAIFLSPHKFIGGPGTPGLLIAKKHLFRNRVPSQPGGGTVSFVTAWGHRYVSDIVRREEGGTPDIIGSIRAGLVFQLKAAVGEEAIRHHEADFIQRAIARWDAHDNIDILGNKDAWRLSIVSFQLRHRDRYLHHTFVVALLNDLFGIQARSGCSCAGPYGHRLLGIDPSLSSALEEEIVRGCVGIRPGWVRMNFNYFIREEVFDYLLRAVLWIADHGWKLLPHYQFCAQSGLWRHRDSKSEAPMRLRYVTYRSGHMEFRSRHATEPIWALTEYLEEADRVLENALKGYPDRPCAPQPLPEHFEALRTFPLPYEAYAELVGS